MKPASYNPFEDKSLHFTQQSSGETLAHDRAAFNDAIRHMDSVQGLQAPKRIGHFPKWYQNPQRIGATISVLIFAAFLVYHTVTTIAESLTGK